MKTLQSNGHRFRSWDSAEENYSGLEQANRINYGLMLWEQGKWEAIYRLVFPQEAPWGPVQLREGVTCSPYQWDKLIERLTELLVLDGKTPADNWRRDRPAPPQEREAGKETK